MKEPPQKIKAVALMSTGLDSLLAARIVQQLGIAVHGVCFTFQFDNLAAKADGGAVEELVRPLGIPISIEDITEEYFPVWLNPEHGYGSGVNPCIDCHLFMIRKAKAMMDTMGAHFLVTGEVVGQRPMSQNKPTLFHVDKVSGCKGLLLRPLSAKILPPTIPEEKGWVDRERLYDISGRSRKRQMALAEALGIKKYNAPAGGCILTEPNFSRRVEAFFEKRGKEAITVEDLKLMRLGRHFWPRKGFQVIVGRDEKDNLALEAFQEGRHAFEALDTDKGPLVLATGIQRSEDVETAASITAAYTKAPKNQPLRIGYRVDGENGEVTVSPTDQENLKAWRV